MEQLVECPGAVRLDHVVDDAQILLGPFEGPGQVPGGEDLPDEEGSQAIGPLLGEERTGARLPAVRAVDQIARQDREPLVVEGGGRVPVEDPGHLGQVPRPGADLLYHRVQQVGLAQGLEGAARVGGGRGRFRRGQQVPHEWPGVVGLRPQRAQAFQIAARRRAAWLLRRGPAEHRRALPRACRRREEQPQVVL